MATASPRRLQLACAAAAVLAAAACASLGPSSPRSTASPAQIAELVEPDPDVESRDLFYGAGGRANAPPTKEQFRFLERDDSGASPNIEVEDRRGRKWDAKLGTEARSEVVASRLLWAAGFHQPPVYFVREWMIADGPEAGPQQPARFRLEREDWKKDGDWAWQDNPFVGTRELRGLVVLMAVINNWDLKSSNNRIYRRAEASPSRLYVVKDLGQAFGHSRRMLLGSHSDIGDFTEERLIRDVDGDRVDLDFKVNLRTPGVERDIRVADVLWTCRRLARLSDEQWRDAFRAGGYTPEESAAYIAHLQRKIREGLALAERARS